MPLSSPIIIAIVFLTAVTPVSGVETVPPKADNTDSIAVGATLPAAPIQTLDGKTTTLTKALEGKPTVLIVYRGGWCPYCNAHLGQVQTIEGQLRDLGFQVVGLSPDRPEELRKTLEKDHLTYRLLSDSKAEAIKALGLAFQVDDATLTKYKEYHIDLEEASGEKHHLLPVPAVLLIDEKGLVRYVHTNPDYKHRLDPGAILEAARKGAAESTLPPAKKEDTVPPSLQ